MTRKDYVKFAEMLKGEFAISKNEAEWYRVQGIKFSIADIFAADSLCFDRERFYKACEV